MSARRGRVSGGRALALVLGTCSLALCSAAALVATAQEELDFAPDPIEGMEAAPDELEAWMFIELGRYVKAREVAERVLRRRPGSFVAHMVLGNVEHYAEANFPRALYHLDIALRRFEARYGREPGTHAPWRWHSRLLRELAATHGDLEHHSDKLAYTARYNLLYDPDMIADRAWPLMKLGRYGEARRAARFGISSGDAIQRSIGLNALCAIEFEAGNDGASYIACRRAMDEARASPTGPDAVDLTNFAEASRSVFKLDETESISLEATRANTAWYGNPWMDLADLYTREGRFAEALAALREVPRYRNRRPPHVRDADRNESRRVLSCFYLVAGRPGDALRITSKALVMPDRRAHNSRDPAQDLSIAALLDRRARLVAAEMKGEEAVGGSLWTRVRAAVEGEWLRAQAWTSGRMATRLLSDDVRLVGTFRIGTSTSAIMPPWLAGELVDVAGAGVVREAVRRARARDHRPGASAYYDAFEAEAALGEGDEARSVELGARAVRALGPGEAMLRSRTQAVLAEAFRRQGNLGRAASMYDEAMQHDPGVLRRLGLALPVRISASGGEVAERAATLVGRSPRFDEDGDSPIAVRIQASARGGRACIVGRQGAVLGCGDATARRGDDTNALAGRVVAALHAGAFAPRVDLSQSDISSLDGSNRVSRDVIHDVMTGGPSVSDEPLDE